jgi:electron transport complex protein RnfG
LKKDFIGPIIALTLVCLIISGALAFGNTATRPVIEKAAAERAESARKSIIPDADDFVPIEAEGLPESITEVYGTSNNVGFIFKITAKGGYSGDIIMACGIDPDGKVIKSTVLEHKETEGLGTIVFDKAVEYEGKEDKYLENIDAISGATITFKAYYNGIKDAFEAFEAVKGVQP